MKAIDDVGRVRQVAVDRRLVGQRAIGDDDLDALEPALPWDTILGSLQSRSHEET